MWISRLTALILFCIPTLLMAQVGIGTTNPSATAQLDVYSTTKGFLPPRMTAAQRGAINSPATGLLVYQTDSPAGLYYHGTSGWVYVLSNSSTLQVENGGTGLTSTPANGQIDIGNGTGFTRTTLTAGSSITITNSSGTITIAANIRPSTEQFTATAGQTSFTLAQTPLNNKIWMFINGVRTNINGYGVSGTLVTYTASGNNNYTLVAGDRIQFDYSY